MPKHWYLAPFSWLYGLVTDIRNQLFDWNVLHSESFPLPVIGVGNLTVGGTGKTPHTEYLIHLLKDEYRVAFLSRGYRRKSKGYLLASEGCSALDIGDEPYQVWQHHPDIHVAVDADRCEGIRRLCSEEPTADTQGDWTFEGTYSLLQWSDATLRCWANTPLSMATWLSRTKLVVTFSLASSVR